jgi:hypothetical protein
MIGTRYCTENRYLETHSTSCLTCCLLPSCSCSGGKHEAIEVGGIVESALSSESVSVDSAADADAASLSQTLAANDELEVVEDAAAAAAPASQRTRRPALNPYILMQDGVESRPVLQCRCGLAFALLVVALVLLVLGATHRAGGDTPVEADARASLLYGIGGGGVALALVLLVWTAAHMRAAAQRAAAEAASSSALEERAPIAAQSAADGTDAEIDSSDASEQALSISEIAAASSSSFDPFSSLFSPSLLASNRASSPPPLPATSVGASGSAVLIVCAQCSNGFDAAMLDSCPLCHPLPRE